MKYDLAFTGHRPDKLGGYNPETRDRLHNFAVWWLTEFVARNPQLEPHLIVGMAQGWDMAVARAGDLLGIPFSAYLPGSPDEQCGRWPAPARLTYKRLLDRAADVYQTLAPGSYLVRLQRRNKIMVDNCQTLVTLWNGSSGGTQHCRDYAVNCAVPIIDTWPLFEAF